MSEQIVGKLIQRNNRRRDVIKSRELKGKGRIYFNNKNVAVNLRESRPGGIGIEVAQRKFNRLNIKVGDTVKLAMIVSTGNEDIRKFVIKHITKDGINYKIGLQYEDGSILSNGQRTMELSNEV